MRRADRLFQVIQLMRRKRVVTAATLAAELEVSERTIYRDIRDLVLSGVPIEGEAGVGYMLRKGFDLPPLMFTAVEAIGLVMAVLEGHQLATDPTDLVGSALAKIVRVLPERVAEPVIGYCDVSLTLPRYTGQADPEVTARLIEACTAGRRLRVGYDNGRTVPRQMEVDPWTVLLRHSYWYLLCWSHTAGARRVLRIDRVVSIDSLVETFSPPKELDGLGTLEDHLSQGWRYEVDVLVEAPLEESRRFVPRSLANLEPIGGGETRLRATTDDPEWYARQLAALPFPWRVVASKELVEAVDGLARQLRRAAHSAGCAAASPRASRRRGRPKDADPPETLRVASVTNP